MADGVVNDEVSPTSMRSQAAAPQAAHHPDVHSTQFLYNRVCFVFRSDCALQVGRIVHCKRNLMPLDWDTQVQQLQVKVANISLECAYLRHQLHLAQLRTRGKVKKSTKRTSWWTHAGIATPTHNPTSPHFSSSTADTTQSFAARTQESTGNTGLPPVTLFGPGQEGTGDMAPHDDDDLELMSLFS